MAINSIDSSFFTSGSSSGGSLLGDYASIKNGSYKKLLNAYYKKTSQNEKATEAEKTEKKNLVLAKDAAVKMSESASALKDLELTEDNRENIKKSVKNFVDAYNRMVDAGSDVDSAGVLKNTLWMTQVMQKNSAVLDDIGISVGDGNKLILDEEKLDKAKLTTLSTIFKGVGSIADKMAGRASKIATLAATEAVKGTRASDYTNKIDFKSLTSGSMYDALI